MHFNNPNSSTSPTFSPKFNPNPKNTEADIGLGIGLGVEIYGVRDDEGNALELVTGKEGVGNEADFVRCDTCDTLVCITCAAEGATFSGRLVHYCPFCVVNTLERPPFPP